MITQEQVEENIKRGWAIIDGFPFHRVTLDGRVQTQYRPGINNPLDNWIDRSLVCNTGRYIRLCLKHNGIGKSFNVHRLVATYFVFNDMEKPCVNHKDGNRFNNNYENLEWMTVSENTKHAYDNGLAVGPKGDRHGNHRFKNRDIIEMRSLASSGVTHKKIAEIFKTRQSSISRIIKRDRWGHVA